MRHPASTKELMRGLVEASKDSHVFPEIFRFTQTMWMHLGTKPYHAGNRRVKMQVHVRDLQLRYGLSVEALQHIVSVCCHPCASSFIRFSTASSPDKPERCIDLVADVLKVKRF